MAIKYIKMEFAGQPNDLQPRRGIMVTTDSLATITTAGYLNNNPSTAGTNFFANDFIFVNYNAPFASQIGGSTGLFTVGITAGVITLSLANEPSYVQGITPGTSAPSKAIVLDSNSSIDSVPWSQIETAANLTTAQVASVTTTSTTPATGTCAAQFRLNVFGGAAIAYIAPIMFYVSTSAGAISTAATSVAALTNGQVASLITGQVMIGTSTTGGLLGITLTASAGTYYVTFLLPNGEKSISSALVVN